jgi:hypothetical protein
MWIVVFKYTFLRYENEYAVQNHKPYKRFKFFVVIIHIVIFWIVTPHSDVVHDLKHRANNLPALFQYWCTDFFV